MAFDNFIKEFFRKGLIKSQKVDFKSIENHIARALQEIKAAQANLTIDEGIAYTIAYTAILHAGRALMFLKGIDRPTVISIKPLLNSAALSLGINIKS